MAEFCLDCFNELNGTDYTKKQVWLDDGFCEGCAEWKPCVVDLRPKSIIRQLFDTLRQLFNQ